MDWQIKRRADLARGAEAAAKPASIRPLAYPGDDSAHEWTVTVTNDGAPVDLTGATVTGYFYRHADGATPFISGTASENVASVKLPAEAYALGGYVTGVLRATLGGEIMTLDCIVFAVGPNVTGQLIDPGEVVNIDVVLAQIDRMEAATEEAEEMVTDYVAIKSENHVVAVVKDVEWEIGYTINGNGTLITNFPYAAVSKYRACEPGDILRYTGPAKDGDDIDLAVYVHFYSAAKAWQSPRVWMVNASVTVPAGAAFYRMTFGRAQSTQVELTQEDIDTYFSLEHFRNYAPRTVGDAAVELFPTMVMSDPVGAMMACAETYFDYCYQPGTHLVYYGGRGLFSDNLYSSDYPDKFAIVCSQFCTALIKGISWENSRYVLGASAINHMQDWGFMTDGTGTYGREAAGESDSTAVALDYMWASEMFRYAENHGFPTYAVTESHPMVRPGDLLFWAKPDATDDIGQFYKHIRHVALVLGVGYDNNYATILEADESQRPDTEPFIKHDGGVIGVRCRTIVFTNWHYGARFPVDPSPHKAQLMYSEKSISGTLDANASTIRVIPLNLPRGFYTLVMHGTVNDAVRTLRFGVRYEGDQETTKIAGLRNGTMQYGFVYVEQDDFQDVRIIAQQGSSYDIQDFAIYRGYFRPDSGVYGRLV